MTKELDRKNFIGSSDAAAILGISPWKTPLQLYQEKIGEWEDISTPEKEEIFWFGKHQEDIVVQRLETLGFDITARNKRYVDAQKDFLTCEIDAETSDNLNIEIKTAKADFQGQWGRQGSDEIPMHYCAQVMHALMITKKPRCLVTLLLSGSELRTYQVERDEEVIQAIRDNEEIFWRCVQNKTPPKIYSNGDVNRMFPRSNECVKYVDDSADADDAIEAFQKLLDLKEQKQIIQKDIDTCEKILKSFMGDFEVLKNNDQKLVTWKTQYTRRFDLKAFEKDHPDLAKLYRKKTTSRVFKLIDIYAANQ